MWTILCQARSSLRRLAPVPFFLHKIQGHDRHARNRAAAFNNRDDMNLKTFGVAVMLEEIIFSSFLGSPRRGVI